MQQKKKLALEHERARLTQLYERQLAAEQHSLQERLLRELEIRDAQMRAADPTFAAHRYSSLGSSAKDKMKDFISKEMRLNFKCVTTDEGESKSAFANA